MELIKKNVWIILLVGFVLTFFWQFFAKGLLPIPADTIVGLYHPFLDYYAKVSPQGVPFQNFLITDPVRQLIPWKSLVIDSFISGSLPLWNPYEMAGKPLLANFQSGSFYPFNILLFLKPFDIFWSIFIILQPLLAGLFMFIYLSSLKLDRRAALLGSITFSFSGFSIAWLEWGNIIHTALWLPLILFSIDKLAASVNFEVFGKKNIWGFILLASMICSFLAGHLQTFFYIYIISFAYFIFRLFGQKEKKTLLSSYLILNALFFTLTFIQWYPTLQFISLSGRELDVVGSYLKDGWFIPYQNLIQFVAPDFFGNPATLNYWGVWNYGEFAGYVGVVALFFAFLALFIKKNKYILFFAGTIIVALIFALPNPISLIPFQLNIPFLGSAQPTRLIFPIVFALSILASFGFNSLLEGRINKKWIALVFALFTLTFLTLWLIVLGKVSLNIKPEDLLVAKRNLMLPTGIFTIGAIIILILIAVKEELTREFMIVAIIVLCAFDIFRFGSKFTPFTNPDYFYPKTSVISFLQKDKSVFRVATTDSRILAPNIATYYKIASIEGYDPLYLLSYAQLIASSERSSHSIKPPYGFNRIITPRNTGSAVFDLLNVKYVLSFTDLPKEEFEKVFSEGQTKVYRNKSVFPRAFFVKEVIATSNPVQEMFKVNLRETAFVEKDLLGGTFSTGRVNIETYSPNSIVLTTKNNGLGFLVFSDSYYPTWEALIDGKQTEIYKTDINFRGIVVPKGSHVIEFKNHLL